MFGTGPVTSVRSTVAANGYRQASVIATTNRGGPVPTVFQASNGQASALASAMPDPLEVVSILAGTGGRERVAQDFDVGGTSDILGVVALGAVLSFQGDGTAMSHSAAAAFAIDLAQLGSAQDLLIGLLEPNVRSGGFDSLRFQIFLEGLPTVDEMFYDIVTARTFFDGRTLDFGSILAPSSDGILDLDFILTMTSSRGGDGFAVDLIFGNSTVGAGVVPVPPAVVLFLSALGSLFATRRLAGKGRADQRSGV
jgi:hypothetical protein